MKMKLFKLTLIVAGLTIFLFNSCTEEFPEREPSPVTPSDCVGIYFPSSNTTSYEIEPTVTSIPVTISRVNKSDAITVPITVVKNPNNVFVIPQSVAFTAGQETTTFNVTYPTAEDGVKYTFEIAVEGEKFVDPYKIVSGAPSVAKSVTKIKWNVLGTAQFYDAFTLYSVATGTLSYTPTKDMYRLTNPYTIPLLEEAEWAEWINGPFSDYIVFKITSAGKVTWDFWYIGLTYQGGGKPVKAYFPSFLAASQAQYDAFSTVVEGYDKKLLVLYPYFYMDGLGGWSPAKKTNPVYISMPGGPDLTTLLGL